MANISNVSFRIDSDLKAQADTLFSQLGMNMTTAFNIFLRQSVREGRIPFDITINTPNSETVAAMLETERMLRDPNLNAGQTLPEEYNDHQLTGNLKDYRECHIQPDWLLMYRIEKNILVLTLQRTGTHSDLFDK